MCWRLRIQAALAKLGPLELKPLMAQALQMGDEVHNRNAAASSLFLKKLVPGRAAQRIRSGGNGGSDHLRRRQRSLLPQSLHGGLQGHAGCGARRAEQQPGHGHVAQRRALRHSVVGHRGAVVRSAGAGGERAVLSRLRARACGAGHGRQLDHRDRRAGRLCHGHRACHRPVRRRHAAGCHRQHARDDAHHARPQQCVHPAGDELQRHARRHRCAQGAGHQHRAHHQHRHRAPRAGRGADRRRHHARAAGVLHASDQRACARAAVQS